MTKLKESAETTVNRLKTNHVDYNDKKSSVKRARRTWEAEFIGDVDYVPEDEIAYRKAGNTEALDALKCRNKNFDQMSKKKLKSFESKKLKISILKKKLEEASGKKIFFLKEAGDLLDFSSENSLEKIAQDSELTKNLNLKCILNRQYIFEYLDNTDCAGQGVEMSINELIGDYMERLNTNDIPEVFRNIVRDGIKNLWVEKINNWKN